MSALGAIIFACDKEENKLLALTESKVITSYIAGDLLNINVIKKIIENYGDQVDVLINNIGFGGYPKKLIDTKLNDLRYYMKINFEIAAILCKGIIPKMVEKGAGKVINVATVLADNPLVTTAAYSASKSALIAFSKAIAIEYAPKNIQINILAPGYFNVNSRLNEYFNTQEGKDFALSSIPIAKPGSIENILDAFVFLSSEASNYMVGHVLKIDGGYSI